MTGSSQDAIARAVEKIMSERLSKSQVTRTVEVRFLSCPCLYVLLEAFHLFI